MGCLGIMYTPTSLAEAYQPRTVVFQTFLSMLRLVILINSAKLLLNARASCDLSPCRHMPFAGPEGAPPRAPCIRQTDHPVTAGALQVTPVLLARAWHFAAPSSFANLGWML